MSVDSPSVPSAASPAPEAEAPPDREVSLPSMLLLALVVGIVAGVDQIVAVADTLNNVPERGVYNYEPGAYFGIYHPDGFWFDCGASALAGKHG